MYIQLISIHGLIRGNDIEMGRDADTGGQVRYVLELARTLCAFEGVDQIDLFTRQIRDKRVSADYGKQIEELGEKCRIVRLPCGGGKYIRKEKLWPYLDDFVDAMITFTRKEGRQPTVVHGHYADAGYIGKEVASAFGAPFVFTGHSLGRDKKIYLEEQGMSEEAINRDFNMARRIEVEEDCLATADTVIASTTHERDTQYGRYYNGKVPRFEILPPGTDLDRFFPYYDYDFGGAEIGENFKQARVRMVEEMARFHFHQQKPLILALCRPDKRKNIHALVETYGRDKELQALANLAVFAGIRKNIAEMEEGEQQVLTDILLMMDRYDLYGKMAVPKRHESQFDVPEMYRLAASLKGIFVNPAYVEPFGLTFIEASAVGLPFVGTKNGGPQDIVANCESGLLVDVENYEEVGAAMRKLLTDSEMWQQCSSNGINKVREFYTWKRHCELYLEHLREIGSQPARTTFSIGADRAPGQRLAALDSLLITDIDNTLLGDEEAMWRLFELLERNRESIGFGVATGRYLDSVLEMLDQHQLRDKIDIIVSSVGTEIYYGPEHKADKGWASHLRWKWRPERVHEALDEFTQLSLQKDEKTQREFKISYDVDSDADHDAVMTEVRDRLSRAAVPHTLIFSHGTYLDILSHRASKGKAVRYLSGKWNIPLSNIATAGDSGNDRDMLVGQTAGIVVGNYDTELESLRQTSDRVYFATKQCAGGIMEGLEHYGMLELKEAKS